MSTFKQTAEERRFTPVVQTIPLQIADSLGASIVDGAFDEGERLKEVELASLFKVSRATIREALRILENRRLVTIEPQRGARVTVLSAEELTNLFEIRATLVSLASGNASLRRTPADIEALKAGLLDLRTGVKNAAAYVRVSARMVRLIAAMGGNAQLAEMIESFAERIGRYARLGLASQKRRDASLATWRKIIDAIAAGNAERASAEHRALALANRDEAIAIIRLRSGGESKKRRNAVLGDGNVS